MPKTCYFPDGTITNADTPCSESAQFSPCCQPTNACLSNGLCLGINGTSPNGLTRGSCTDPTFRDPSCPYYCADLNRSGPSAVFLVSYNGSLADGAYFCCGGLTDNDGLCKEPSFDRREPFRISNGALIVNRITGEKISNETLPLTRAVSTVTQTAAPSTADSSQQPQRSNSSSSKVGAGVGVPLGVLLLVTATILYMQFRKVRYLRQELKKYGEISKQFTGGSELHEKSEALAFNAPIVTDHKPPISRGRPAELDSDQQHELPSGEPLGERGMVK